MQGSYIRIAKWDVKKNKVELKTIIVEIQGSE